MRFRVAPGARIRRGDVQVVGETFEKLRLAGKLTPEAVLDEAKNPRSVLHKYITWDDESAAHAFRLEQARRLIRAIEIVVEDARGKGVQLKQFFSVRDARGVRSYQPAEYVFSDAALSDQVMREARAQLEGWQKRYKAYAWAAQAMPHVVAALKAVKQATKKRKTK